MDTKRVNIYAGSILGALLLFLLLGFFSNLIYHGPEHAGGEEEVLAYALEVEDAAEGAEETEEVNLAALAAEADPDAGASVFNKCRACHALEQGDHGVGPSLHNVVGDDIASAEGFSYSDALTGLEGDWDLETLSAFLENPQGYAPGTKMSFAGVGDPEDRVNVIAYLNQSGDSPVDLVPEGAETAAAETGTETDAGEQAAEGEDAAGDEPDQQAAAEEAETGDAAEGDAAQEDAAQEDAAQEDATDDEATAQETASTEDQEAAEETAEAAEEDAEETGGGEFAELLANASAEEGEKVYRKCQACHTLDEGKHRVGPSLYGVIGSQAGTAEGYNYSDVMAEFGEDWTLSNLDAYLENPNEFLPGNKMTFPGLKDPQDRIDVFTYIDQSDGERDLPQ